MIVIPRPLFLGISLEDGIETDIKYIMKFTPTMGNQISYWIIQIKSMMSAYLTWWTNTPFMTYTGKTYPWNHCILQPTINSISFSFNMLKYNAPLILFFILNTIKPLIYYLGDIHSVKRWISIHIMFSRTLHP